MRKMTESQYQKERSMWPHGLVVFHDKLMLENLYQFGDHVNWPDELRALHQTLDDLYKEIARYMSYCLDCSIVCASRRNLCISKRKQRNLEIVADDIEREFKDKLSLLKEQELFEPSLGEK